MKKHILYLSALLAALCLSGVAITSCSDPDDVVDLTLARVLSPTSLSATLYQGTNIIVSWDDMTGASYYEIEGYADSDDYDNLTPDYTNTVVAAPDTLLDLYGETTYYIRVRAIDEDDSSRNSLWTDISRTTSEEQKMYDVYSSDYGTDYANVSWIAGTDLDAIACDPTSDDSAASVYETLSSADISAGTYQITGLTPNTEYKVTIQKDGKNRGYATFTTDIDYGAVAGQTVSTIDDLLTAIESGGTIALNPGTYSSVDDKIEITTDVVLAAADPNDPPVINACLQVYGGASLTLYYVALDGDNTDGSQAIEYKEAGDYDQLYIYKTEISNYTKGLIYINVAAVIDAIDIDGALIHDVECSGGDFIDSRKGGWNQLNFVNTTVYESCSSRDWFRADDVSSSVAAEVVTVVDHCTFYNVGNGGTTYRIFYIRFSGNTNTFTNNVVANFTNTRGFANQSSTGEATFSGNYYYNCVNLMSLASGNSQSPSFYDTSGTELTEDPFTDADNGDFTLVDDSYEFGDPRWF